MKPDNLISEDEAALYDRQIRLWGIDAQKSLLKSRILLVNINGVGAEIAKNLVLSGIKSLTILDSNQVTEQDLKSNFLLPHSSIGKNRAESCVKALQTLNPMVEIIDEKESLAEKGEDFFSKENFNTICVLSNELGELIRLNDIARKNNINFLSGYVYGLHGYMFVDFNEYQYIVEAPKIFDEGAEKKTTIGNQCPVSKPSEKLTLVEKKISFKSFSDFLSSYNGLLQNVPKNRLKRICKTYFLILLLNNFNQTFERSFSSNSLEDKENLIKLKTKLFEKLELDQLELDLDQNFGEQSAVNAILGGVIAQEIIKVISGKNEPIDNFFVFDGNQMTGEVIKI